jgi:hypothetical protein
MFALRYAALMATALWTGGIVALGAFAAPAIFDVLASRGSPESRVVAGAVFGEILRRFHPLSYVCGAVVVGSLGMRAALGPRPSRFAWRLATATAMLGSALFAGLVLSGWIEDARQQAGGAPSSLAENDPRRIAFGRLHAASTVLQLVPVAGGMMLMFWELRDR